MKRNRTTLKSYFIKGAIPTEANFADLIDSMLTQDDDNISKLPSDPLRITASGTEENLLNFYRVEAGAETLTWQIKQKPDNKLGLSIGDAATSRLFIESGTGNVGIGTTTPSQKLDVMGNIYVTGNVGVGTTAPSQKLDVMGNIYINNENSGIIVDAGDQKRVGLMKYPSVEGAFVHGNTVPLRFGMVNQAEVTGGTFTEQMRIDTSGNVGIGTATPSVKLEVAGDIKFGATLSTPGRMHINGGEYLYLLHQNGVIIGREWGGNGNLQVQGYVGIGTTNPVVPLHISGGVYRGFPTTSGQYFGLYVEQHAAAVYWHTTSDDRIKLNPTPVDPLRSLKTLLDLTVYEYEYLPEYQPSLAGKRYHGFLAQEVEKVIPEAVSIIGDQKLGEDRAIEGLRVVANDRIFSETVGAIQAVYAILQQQETRIRELEGEHSVDQAAGEQG